MFNILIPAAMAFLVGGNKTMAQNIPPQEPPAAIVAPPVGTLSTTRTTRKIDGNGTQTDSSRTTYRNEAGVADDVHTKTTTHPAPTTTTTSSSTSTTR